MRILTLVAGADSLPHAAQLTAGIRSFNAEIDFRLRFLHVEIEQVYCVPAALATEASRFTERLEVREVPQCGPLEAAGRLALVLDQERPSVLVIVGNGSLLDPGIAAARACATRIAFFGTPRGSAEDGLDLGEDAGDAVERLTGVAREIQ